MLILKKKKNNDEGYIYEIKQNLFYYIKSSKKELKNGFLPIHIFIYDLTRFKLYEISEKLIKNNIPIEGYKVDAR